MNVPIIRNTSKIYFMTYLCVFKVSTKLAQYGHTVSVCCEIEIGFHLSALGCFRFIVFLKSLNTVCSTNYGFWPLDFKNGERVQVIRNCRGLFHNRGKDASICSDIDLLLEAENMRHGKYVILALKFPLGLNTWRVFIIKFRKTITLSFVLTLDDFDFSRSFWLKVFLVF